MAMAAMMAAASTVMQGMQKGGGAPEGPSSATSGVSGASTATSGSGTFSVGSQSFVPWIVVGLIVLSVVKRG